VGLRAGIDDVKKIFPVLGRELRHFGFSSPIPVAATSVISRLLRLQGKVWRFFGKKKSLSP
jgi:hypothetical protein